MEGRFNMALLVLFIFFLGGGGEGGLYLKGRFNRRFLALLVLGGLILGGAYFRNFTVA